MKVLALLADHAGCGSARIEVPYTALRSRGHHVDIAEMLHEGQICNYDIIVLQRPGNKWSLPIADWCQKHHVPLVIELDDLCWRLPEWNPFKKAWDSIVEETGETSWKVQQQTLERAAAATVTREPLAEEIRKFQSHVYVLPNYIDISAFEVPEHNRTPVAVGWFGSHTHQRDVDWISGVVGTVLRDFSESVLVTVGGYGPVETALGHGLAPERHRKIPWLNRRADLNVALGFIDIGLAPLIPDRFNDSKSHIKILEYGGVGVPTIASNTGPYKDFVKQDFGILVETKREWKNALRWMLNNTEKRLEMGRRAREIAEEHSIQNNVWRWEEVLEHVIHDYRTAGLAELIT